MVVIPLVDLRNKIMNLSVNSYLGPYEVDIFSETTAIIEQVKSIKNGLCVMDKVVAEKHPVFF